MTHTPEWDEYMAALLAFTHGRDEPMPTHTPELLTVAVVFDAYHPRRPITVTFGDTEDSRKEAEALARLIAQAPAMLAALRAFFDAYKAHPERLGTSSAAQVHHEAARALLRTVEG